jgi:hypothetical protein
MVELSKDVLSDVIGMRYQGAARALHQTGLYSPYRLLEGYERPEHRPNYYMPDENHANRQWVLLWAEDDEEINPAITRAEVYPLDGE